MTEAAIAYGSAGDVTPDELRALFVQTSWGRHRTTQDIGAMLRASPTAVVARADGALIGYARALTDGLYRALVDDVVVDRAWRGHGIGQELVRRLLEQLAGVEEVRLNCRPELVPFYELMGFRVDEGTQMLLTLGQR